MEFNILHLDIKKYIFSYLKRVDEAELIENKSWIKMKTIYNIIKLCREMGFIHELRSDISGEYADPTNLYFFWHKPKHFKYHIMVARTTTDASFFTSIPYNDWCHICKNSNCVDHQQKNHTIEELLNQKLMDAVIEIIPKKDVFTHRQYMKIYYNS
jgi:Fe2+ or Zn2+ uptake regulation protein